MVRLNEFGQPIGADIGIWKPPVFPSIDGLSGAFVELEPLESDRHRADLMMSFAAAPPSLWTYLPFGPLEDPGDLTKAIDDIYAYPPSQPFAIAVDGVAVGFASYLRVNQRSGVLEIGSIAFSPALQRTTAATEALYLMIDHRFDLGYRRCEWKCDDLNAPSRAAAERLGFRYEGTFRQATHYKGRTRDTAWYSIIDTEWRALRPAFLRWLSTENFDSDGRQLTPLREHRRHA